MEVQKELKKFEGAAKADSPKDGIVCENYFPGRILRRTIKREFCTGIVWLKFSHPKNVLNGPFFSGLSKNRHHVSHQSELNADEARKPFFGRSPTQPIAKLA